MFISEVAVSEKMYGVCYQDSHALIRLIQHNWGVVSTHIHQISQFWRRKFCRREDGAGDYFKEVLLDGNITLDNFAWEGQHIDDGRVIDDGRHIDDGRQERRSPPLALLASGEGHPLRELKLRTGTHCYPQTHFVWWTVLSSGPGTQMLNQSTFGVLK